MPQPAIPCTVTLVHGTFAPNARWVSPGSSLRRNVTRRCGVSVNFHVFRWSGWNTHTSRLKAAARLRQHLIDLGDKFPNVAHFVVAHSHGGTVTLYALRDPAIKAKLAGVACLSTPFIVVQRREDPMAFLTAIGVAL